jgi:hypothetical protein
MKKLLCLFCPIVIALLVYSCSDLTMAGGSSSTDNGKVLGKVCMPDGKPASHVSVTLRSVQYLATIPATPAQISFETSTNDSGRFEIDSLPVGTYTIEVNDNAAMAVLLRCEIVRRAAVVNVPDDTLRSYARLQGHADRGILGTSPAYVQVYGLERTAAVDSSGAFGFPDLPDGLYTLRIVSNDTTFRPVALDSIKLSSGELTLLPYALWGFSKRLYLNTSPTGADVAGEVLGFPVLVRLSQSNFNFAEAGSNGGDLRFTKANGTPLPCEIEQWDASLQQAAIWVKVDTVYGNDSTHSILMYWGNRNAGSGSSSTAVFDTADGFAGVWHLSEKTGNVFDATMHANTGTNQGTSSSAGNIGNGRSFLNSRIFMGASSNLCAIADSITVSGWVNSTQTTYATVSVVRHVGHFTAIQFDSVRTWTSFWTVQSVDYGVIELPSWTSLFGDGTWHYFTARFKAGAGCFVYRDGSLLGQNSNDTARLKTTVGAFYLGGTENSNEYFDGSLDEIRVERAFRSADWIKLCWMNQKDQDALVVFE